MAPHEVWAPRGELRVTATARFPAQRPIDPASFPGVMPLSFIEETTGLAVRSVVSTQGTPAYNVIFRGCVIDCL